MFAMNVNVTTHQSKVKFEHSEKATTILNNLPLDLKLLNKRQIMWEIVSNFVGFLKNLNFNILGPAQWMGIVDNFQVLSDQKMLKCTYLGGRVPKLWGAFWGIATFM